MPYPDRVFSRQEMHEITGIPDDVLGYWLREGLVVPEDLPGRKHRRFTFDQLHLAAVLQEMRGLGANIGVLRNFASLLHRGKELKEHGKFSAAEVWAAASIGIDIARVKEGLPARWGGPPKSEQQIIAAYDWGQETVDRAAVIALASNLTEQEAIGMRAYQDLVDDHSRFEWMWVAWIDATGRALIASGEDDGIAWAWIGPELKPVRAAFYINVSECIRGLWRRGAK